MSNENHSPLVSVIVPSYNHAKHITKCIESIINQTYKNIELIVVDDGSTDNSRSIISSLQNKHQFMTLFQENEGLSSTLTKTIRDRCRGEYVSICASDDFWRSDKIQKQIDLMITDPEYAMCYSKCYYVDEESNIIQNKKLYLSERRFKSGFIFEDLFLLNYHLPVSYLYRKDVLKEFDFFPSNVYTEDFYMNLKISSRYPIVYSNDYLIYYRYQQNSSEKAKKIIESQKAIIDAYKDLKLYNKGVRKWKIRALYTFAGYPELKKESISLLLRIGISTDMRFWKSIVLLLLK